MFVNNEEMAKGAVGVQLRCAKASPGKAGLLLATCLLYLAPAPTVLADNECGLQVGTTPIECPSADYSPDGITYTSVGDLVLNLEPISAFGTSLGSGGLNISAGGLGDSLTVTTERIASFRHTAPVVVDLSTQTGDINLDSSTSSVSFPDIQGNTSATQYGVRAVSSSGSIDLNLGGVTATGTPGIAAVYAETGGAGTIDITTARTVSGRVFGIQAETGGAGALTITANGSVSASSGFGAAAIDATTGTGLLSIDVAGLVNGGNNGTGIRTQAGGDVEIDIANGGQVQAFGGFGFDLTAALDLTAAGAVTVDNDGAIRGGIGVEEFAIRATADSFILNNTEGPGNFDGLIRGAIDFSGLADDGDGYIFNNNGTWDISPGLIINNSNPQLLSTLGAGVFNNAGAIVFGSRESVVQAPGTTFNGLAGSLFDMGMTLSSEGQTSCAAATVAGCLDLSGGSTSGQTSILVTSSAPPLDPAGGLTPEANPGILLVDVSGGTSAADHFMLHPGSENYLDTPFYGGVITTGGPLLYTLLYDPTTQQHWLSSVPTDEGVTYAAFNQEVLSMWHTTADAVVGRQADLREGAARGGWVRVVSDSSERESTLSMTTHGNTFTYEQNYDLDTTAVMFGSDVHSGENHIIGLHAGLVRSHLEFEDSSNRDRTKGAAAGVYGGWWRDLGAGQLTLDGTLNGNFLRLKHWNSFEVTDSDVRSLGIRAEAGWLFPVGEMFYVQPLATAAYVRSNIETLELRQNDLSFEDVNSERAALGVRLGGDVDLSGNRFGNLKYWLTARAWEENAEDGSVDYQTTGDPLSIEDDISESFEEVGLGVSLTSPDNDLNVFLSGGLQSGDQTDSTNVTVGARLRW